MYGIVYRFLGLCAFFRKVLESFGRFWKVLGGFMWVGFLGV